MEGTKRGGGKSPRVEGKGPGREGGEGQGWARGWCLPEAALMDGRDDKSVDGASVASQTLVICFPFSPSLRLPSCIGGVMRGDTFRGLFVRGQG